MDMIGRTSLKFAIKPHKVVLFIWADQLFRRIKKEQSNRNGYVFTETY